MSHIRQCSPVLPVSDPLSMADHYVRIFGFELVGTPTGEYARVAREGHEVHFHQVPGPPPGDDVRGEYRGGAYFLVDDPDALYEELDARGAKVNYAPEDRPYGMRDFSVVDLEGFSLCFGRLLS